MADRYTYIPSIGVFLALTWLIAELADRLKAPKPGGTTVEGRPLWTQAALAASSLIAVAACAVLSRTEERRVGKECRCRWSRDREKKKEMKCDVGRARAMRCA